MAMSLRHSLPLQTGDVNNPAFLPVITDAVDHIVHPHMETDIPATDRDAITVVDAFSAVRHRHPRFLQGFDKIPLCAPRREVGYVYPRKWSGISGDPVPCAFDAYPINGDAICLDLLLLLDLFESYVIFGAVSCVPLNFLEEVCR